MDNFADKVIDPIEPAIDKVHELLGHSPHPAIVMLPLGCWSFSNACDGLAMMTGDERYDDAARLSMGVGLLGAAAAVVTGLRDYSHIPVDRPSHKVATAHALGNSVAGSLFVASYVMRSLDHQAGRRASVASRLLAIAGGGLSMYTAWLGGVLVENYGEGVEPVMQALSNEETGQGRDRLDPDSPLGIHGAASATP